MSDTKAEAYFTAVNLPNTQGFTIVHGPSGLTAGGFHYQRFARQAAAAMNALHGQEGHDLSVKGVERHTIIACVEARAQFDKADAAAWAEKHGGKK